MPIKPQPFILSCTACPWCKLYAPRGDVLSEPIYDRCPRCRNDVRYRRVARPLSAVVDVMADMLFQWRR